MDQTVTRKFENIYVAFKSCNFSLSFYEHKKDMISPQGSESVNVTKFCQQTIFEVHWSKLINHEIDELINANIEIEKHILQYIF